jgi:hypothetical protein
MTRPRIPAVLLSTAAIAAVAIPAAGAATHRSSDRDHDGMPTRWEQSHGLNAHRNDARKDRDHDGLRNLAEFKAGTNPNDADTDNDGIRDGAEDAGTVVSFAGGVLTLKEFSGATITGTVTDATEIECDGDGRASERSRGDDGERGDGGEQGRGGDRGEHGDDGDRHENGAGDDEQDDDAPTGTTGATGSTGATGASGSCGPESLVPGARVDEARLAVTRAGHTFTKVELAG